MGTWQHDTFYFLDRTFFETCTIPNTRGRRALLAVGSSHGRVAVGRGYDHRGQHSWADHAYSGSVDPRIVSWAHRTPQRWAKEESSSFATARRHAEAATSATAKIVGGVPLRCPSLAPPVQTAAPSSDARDTCHVRRNLSTQVKYFFHAERSGLISLAVLYVCTPKRQRPPPFVRGAASRASSTLYAP